MKVGFQIRAKNGLILAAMRKHGLNGRQAAERLGISVNLFYDWLAMKGFPKNLTDMQLASIEEFCGAPLDEIFPEEARCREFNTADKMFEVYADIAPGALIGEHQRLNMLGDPGEVMRIEDLRTQIEDAVSRLSEREEKVFRACHDEGRSLDEVGYQFGVSRERVRQIKTKAENKLRFYLRGPLKPKPNKAPRGPDKYKTS